MIRTKKGLSMIEIVVSIGILVFLTAIAVYTYNGYLTSAEDSKRVIELDNIITSLETHMLRDGKLPMPDDSTDITYSGATIWSQGVFGDDMIRTLGYSKDEVLDPNEESKYTYSVRENGKEYSLAGVLEGDNVKPTVDMVGLSNGGIKTGNAVVMGNYNGAMTHVNTGGTDYVLAIPSIVTTDLATTDLIDILDEKNLVFDGYENLPASYSGSEIVLDNDLDFAPENLVVYSGSLGKLRDEEDRMSLLYVLQKSYSGTTSEGEDFLGSVVNTDIDVIYPDKQALDLSCDLVNKKLNFRVDCDYVNFSSFYVIEDTSILGSIDFTILAGRQVNYISQDGDTLWFGTSDGAFSYDTTTGTWTTYPDTAGFKITVIATSEDGEGNSTTWFGTSDSGLLAYDGTEFANFQSDFDPPAENGSTFTPQIRNNIPSNAIYTIVVEPNTGHLIVGTHNGGAYYDGTFHAFYVVSGGSYYTYSANRMKEFYIDSNNHLWMGTNDGAYYYPGDIESTPSGSLETYDGYNGLPYSTYRYRRRTYRETEVDVIYEDSDNKVWFGTPNGIGKLQENTNPWSWYSFMSDEIYTTTTGEGLANNDIKSIFKDPTTGSMWFGTNEGVSVLSGSTFTNYTRDVDGGTLGPVYYIYQDESGLNILGAQNGSRTVE